MDSVKDKRVACLGLGIMGSAMASNLAKAGAQVSGWNRTPGRAAAHHAATAGVKVHDQMAEAVKEAEVIITCLGDESDVEQLLTEVGPLAAPQATVIDTTTIGPAAARRAEQILQPHSLRFLDAPVTGGDVGARQGTLTILVGGAREHFLACKPVFDVIGKRIFHCGPTGCGQSMKLCNQILCAVNMIAVSEALQLASAMDIDSELLIQSLSEGAGGSWALSNLGPRIVSGDFGPGFTLGHMLKDLRLVRENGADLELPGTAMAENLFEQAKRLGGDAGERQGTQAMFRVYKESCSGAGKMART
jgi:3-hydroxyisobutyrate dehydrogenase